MPLVGEEENATGRGGGGGECQWYRRGRRRMPLVGEGEDSGSGRFS